MSFKLMSEARQDHLIKCAESVADLTSAGIDPTSALRKVAEDAGLNANEIKRVSEAVNNASQLHVLQTEKPENRGKIAPLSNAEQVIGELYPDKKAEVDEDRAKQPDALEISDRINKTAVAKSLEDSGFYFQDQPTDHAQFFKTALALEPVTYRKTAGRSELELNDLRYLPQIDAARLEASRLQDQAQEKIAAAATLFRRVGGAKFATVTQLAVCDPLILDLIWESENLAKIGHSRDNVKLAAYGKVPATAADLEAVALLHDADLLVKQAIDYQVCELLLKGERAEKERSLLQKFAEDKGGSSFKTTADLQIDKMPGHVEGVQKDLLGDNTPGQLLGGALDVSKGDSESSDKPFQLPVGIRQQMANTDTQHQIEDLMQDEFVGGHDLPKVVDAYNRAISVNPNFGRAELLSYIRQDLATDGGVPLDTMIRATKSHSPERGDA